MANLNGSGAARGRRLIVAALLALGLVAGVTAFVFWDDLAGFVQSVAMGKLDRAQGHIRY
jgi:hypothetical protein